MDLSSLSDSDFSDHLNAVIAEQERRQRLANVPEQIAVLASAFIADGGDRAALVDAIPAA